MYRKNYIKWDGKPITVLSLFNGMSCAMIALKKLGIPVKAYYSAEIDKYANIVSQANYPEIIQLGSVSNWRNWQLPKVDMILAGSPCQGFSFAGKQLAFDDPRSKLFFDFVACIKFFKPKWFLLENVAMKKRHLKVITDLLETYPIKINSALVSAQNRVRYYWCNWSTQQPEDKRIMLKDVLENGFVDRAKSHCLDACYAKGGNLKQYFEKSRRQLVFKRNYLQEVTPKGNHSQQDRYFYEDTKHGCLVAGTNNNAGSFTGVCIRQRARGYNKGNDFSKKAPTLTSNSWQHNNHVIRTKSKTVRTGGRLSGLDDRHEWDAISDQPELEYRRLTPVECERLQTVPDNYTNYVSNSQRYKMLGNGWTVDVIAHLLNNLVNPPTPKGQQKLF